MRRIVCSVLLIAVGMVFGAVAGEAMESRTYPMSVFFEEKLYAAAESSGIPCQWDDPEKWHLSVFELLGVDWPEGSSIKRVIFNVFKDADRDIYRALLGPDEGAA